MMARAKVVAVVTGACRGIGATTARRLAAGATLWITGVVLPVDGGSVAGRRPPPA